MRRSAVCGVVERTFDKLSDKEPTARPGRRIWLRQACDVHFRKEGEQQKLGSERVAAEVLGQVRDQRGARVERRGVRARRRHRRVLEERQERRALGRLVKEECVDARQLRHRGVCALIAERQVRIRDKAQVQEADDVHDLGRAQLLGLVDVCELEQRRDARLLGDRRVLRGVRLFIVAVDRHLAEGHRNVLVALAREQLVRPRRFARHRHAKQREALSHISRCRGVDRVLALVPRLGTVQAADRLLICLQCAQEQLTAQLRQPQYLRQYPAPCTANGRARHFGALRGSAPFPAARLHCARRAVGSG